MCFNESYSRVRVGKTIRTHFLLRMVQKKETLYHHLLQPNPAHQSVTCLTHKKCKWSK